MVLLVPVFFSGKPTWWPKWRLLKSFWSLGHEVMCLHPQEKVQVCVVYAVVQPGSLEMTHTHRQAERIVGFLIFFSNICYCFVATFWSCTSWYYVAKSLWYFSQKVRTFHTFTQENIGSTDCFVMNSDSLPLHRGLSWCFSKADVLGPLSFRPQSMPATLNWRRSRGRNSQQCKKQVKLRTVWDEETRVFLNGNFHPVSSTASKVMGIQISVASFLFPKRPRFSATDWHGMTDSLSAKEGDFVILWGSYTQVRPSLHIRWDEKRMW